VAPLGTEAHQREGGEGEVPLVIADIGREGLRLALIWLVDRAVADFITRSR